MQDVAAIGRHHQVGRRKAFHEGDGRIVGIAGFAAGLPQEAQRGVQARRQRLRDGAGRCQQRGGGPNFFRQQHQAQPAAVGRRAIQPGFPGGNAIMHAGLQRRGLRRRHQAAPWPCGRDDSRRGGVMSPDSLRRPRVSPCRGAGQALPGIVRATASCRLRFRAAANGEMPARSAMMPFPGRALKARAGQGPMYILTRHFKRLVFRRPFSMQGDRRQ
ncbi:hypothetical protein WJ978_02690 [Achromobacter xylosoxidans]